MVYTYVGLCIAIYPGTSLSHNLKRRSNNTLPRGICEGKVDTSTALHGCLIGQTVCWLSVIRGWVPTHDRRLCDNCAAAPVRETDERGVVIVE